MHMDELLIFGERVAVPGSFDVFLILLKFCKSDIQSLQAVHAAAELRVSFPIVDLHITLSTPFDTLAVKNVVESLQDFHAALVAVGAGDAGQRTLLLVPFYLRFAPLKITFLRRTGD